MNDDWRDSQRLRRASRRRLLVDESETAAPRPCAMDAMLCNGMQGLFDAGLPRPTRAEAERIAIRLLVGDA